MTRSTAILVRAAASLAAGYVLSGLAFGVGLYFKEGQPFADYHLNNGLSKAINFNGHFWLGYVCYSAMVFGAWTALLRMRERKASAQRL
jgi:hypothetical protein